MMQPAEDWVNPYSFAQWVGSGISAGLVERMLANRRLKSRCADLVSRRLGPFSPSQSQGAALSLDGPSLTKLAHHVGAIWHAASIVRLIDGAAVRKLIDRIGPELRLSAIRNIALAPPLPADDIASEALPTAIALAGQCCLAAWCDTQPTAVGVRIALRLAPHEPPQASHRAFGPAIVDVVLMRIDELTT
jgi:hypothetical protein